MPACEMTLADALRTNGLALCGAAQAFGPLWAPLVKMAEDFAESERVKSGTSTTRKQFLIKLRQECQAWIDDALCQCGKVLLPAIHEVHPGSRFYSADMWYVMPSGDKPREWSQKWHRDPEAETVIKAMCFFWEVTDECGPTEYVLRSHGVNYDDVLADHNYTNADIMANVNPSDIVSLKVPAGTLAIMDTSGIHRGGYAKTKPRLSATWTYVKGLRA